MTSLNYMHNPWGRQTDLSLRLIFLGACRKWGLLIY